MLRNSYVMYQPAMKKERIEFVAPHGFKARLQQEAANEKISVGELIRQRFERTEEEKELALLTRTLKKDTREAGASLAQAIAEITGLVAELKSRRGRGEQKAA